MRATTDTLNQPDDSSLSKICRTINIWLKENTNLHRVLGEKTHAWSNHCTFPRIATLRVAALSGSVNIKHVWHQACPVSCHQPGIAYIADTISTILPATLQSQTKAKTHRDYSVPCCTRPKTVYSCIIVIIYNKTKELLYVFHSVFSQ